MPDQSMIERVARALCDNQESHELNWEAWAHAARAVLREMREPTEAIAAAIATVIHREADDAGPEHDFRPAEFIDDAVDAWRAAIDAALGDGR